MPDVTVIDASTELNMLRFLKAYKKPFEVIGTYRLIDDGVRPEATVTLRAGKVEMHEADLGVGPVDALANVLKKSLGQLFPDLVKVRLLDFKVRLIEGSVGTSSQIEVSVVFSDTMKLWRVVQVDDNVNLASFRALLDGYEYAIYLWGKGESKIQGPTPKTRTRIQPPRAAKPKPAKTRTPTKAGSKSATTASSGKKATSGTRGKSKK